METGYTSDVDLEAYEVEYTSLLEEGFMPVEETALEVPVQEQHRFIPSTSDGICLGPKCVKPD